MFKYVIGLDFGTDSVRALLVNAITGEEINSGTGVYARWKAGSYCDPEKSQFRQHPLDYLEAMKASIQEALNGVPLELKQNISGLSIDTTGSTPVAVDETNTPLSLLPGFEENPNAMFLLWKDHTAMTEADEINTLAHGYEVDYTKYSGGIYSAEWFWAKILHVLRVDAAVAKKAYSWVEHCDWITSLLTGISDPLSIKRSRCAAGHKALWHEAFGGLPSEAFLEQLDPRLSGLRERLYTETYTSDEPAGMITPQWAKELGLPKNIVVGVGALDAHFGAAGAGIQPGSLVKVMGTSTCDMLVVPFEEYKDHFVQGICGQVNGSIIPGMLGMEAGQSAFGDLYNWFCQLLSFPLKDIGTDLLSPERSRQLIQRILPVLNEKAAALPLSEEDPVALDWINGRRTPDADLSLKSAIIGLHLGITAPHIFKSLVEATAFGSKAIVERFQKKGIPVESVVALGGISKKSPFAIQVLSDVLDMPISVIRSDQACALGAAMFAATACGIHSSIQHAQMQMASGFEEKYLPRKQNVLIYEKLYRRYQDLAYGSNRQKNASVFKSYFNLEEL